MLVDVVSEFLEAALHTILYSRELYPLSMAVVLSAHSTRYQRAWAKTLARSLPAAGRCVRVAAFSKVKKYNAAVYMCRHPDVAFYIRHAVASLQPLLRQV